MGKYPGDEANHGTKRTTIKLRNRTRLQADDNTVLNALISIRVILLNYCWLCLSRLHASFLSFPLFSRNFCLLSNNVIKNLWLRHNMLAHNNTSFPAESLLTS